ncbi:hypothetical protein [Crenothrix polyspora]|uniref:Uncharacterized protein n=1 Tax=Crenothrix polyspora TaxID=360316 RepID=A0A1R4H9B9_9GAMM|nr:hypothetical protein [Crenothrix polyspora]SJM92852.1 conserved exported hypothetical protein [Crenothrix polyspora]
MPSKTLCSTLFSGAALLCLLNSAAFAENRAANISITRYNSTVDKATLQTARKIIVQAIANGTVDTFVVYSPRLNGSNKVGVGMSVCAEAGFHATQNKFKAFLKKLDSMHVKDGVVLNTRMVKNCTIENETTFKNSKGKIKVFVATRGNYQYLLDIGGKLYFPDVVPDSLKLDGQSVIFSGNSLIDNSDVYKPASNDAPIFDFNAQNIHITHMSVK